MSPRDTIPSGPPDLGVDREFVTLAADDLAELAWQFEGAVMTLRGLIAAMRQAAEDRGKP